MRNITANAILNLKEQSPTLYVHGSIMTYRMDDKVIITKASPQGINPSILVLDLKVIEGNGPRKGTPKSFAFETSGAPAQQYNQVTTRYSPDASITMNVEISG